MEFSLTLWLISFCPIIVLLILITFFKIDARESAFISCILAVLIAVYFFKLTYSQLFISVKKGSVLSLYIILIIIGAIFLYNIVEISGGFEAIKDFIKSLQGDKSIMFLGLSWAFTGFIQGITGFGVPIAIVGSLLVGIGFKPIPAMMAVLIGHSWAISFGTMGSSFFALTLVTQLDSLALGKLLAWFFFIPIISTGIFVAYIYEGIGAVKKNIKYILPIGFIMSFVQLFAAIFALPHIGSLLAGISGTVFFVLIIYFKFDLDFSKTNDSKKMPLLFALLPYALLVIFVLFFQLPFIVNLLPEIKLDFAFPGFTTEMGYEVQPKDSYSPIALFTHPFFFLFVSSLIGISVYLRNQYLNSKKIKKVFYNSYKKARLSVQTVCLLIIMAIVMDNSGMIFMFADGMARISGVSFPFFSPFVGMLGAFLTGSNTSSNIFFGSFQIRTANMLDYSPYTIASIQSVGGSLGSAISPAKILLGTSIVGLMGEEGELIKKSLGYTLISGFLVGIAAMVLEIFL